jgi:hypothetical protein
MGAARPGHVRVELDGRTFEALFGEVRAMPLDRAVEVAIENVPG